MLYYATREVLWDPSLIDGHSYLQHWQISTGKIPQATYIVVDNFKTILQEVLVAVNLDLLDSPEWLLKAPRCCLHSSVAIESYVQISAHAHRQTIFCFWPAEQTRVSLWGLLLEHELNFKCWNHLNQRSLPQDSCCGLHGVNMHLEARKLDARQIAMNKMQDYSVEVIQTLCYICHFR